MAGPLEGIRIVDLTQVVAGPVCTMLLAEQGAEVIKVEFPGLGDILRHNHHYEKNGVNALELNCNRGKKSIAIDMESPEGVELIRELANSADVFIQNFRAGVIERLGITHEDLRAANPNLITVWLAGFGNSGPWADVGVFDPVIQAASGHVAAQLNPKIPFEDVHRTILIDKSTALTSAQAISAALFARERDPNKRGQHIELNMLDNALFFFWPDGGMAHTLIDDEGVSDGMTLYQIMSVIDCADGKLTYYVANEANFKGMFRTIGKPEWAEDPTYYTSEGRATDPAISLEIAAAIESGFAALPRDEAIRRLRANDVPHGPVLGIGELHEFEQTIHNGSFHEWEHPKAGRLRQPRAAARFSDTTLDYRWWVPELGENTDDVLREVLGRDDDQIAELRGTGTVA
ncbi:MAG: CoA transferase [Actinomycetota bacterium]